MRKKYFTLLIALLIGLTATAQQVRIGGTAGIATPINKDVNMGGEFGFTGEMNFNVVNLHAEALYLYDESRWTIPLYVLFGVGGNMGYLGGGVSLNNGHKINYDLSAGTPITRYARLTFVYSFANEKGWDDRAAIRLTLFPLNTCHER